MDSIGKREKRFGPTSERPDMCVRSLSERHETLLALSDAP